jgi:hypothetical protein
MKRLLLVGAALVAMLPMSAFARDRAGVFFGPYPYGTTLGAANLGQVKIDSNFKDAEVFINGAFARTLGQLKTMNMRAGGYNIEVREPGRQPFQAKVFVVPGKTMKLHPDRIPTAGGSTGS